MGLSWYPREHLTSVDFGEHFRVTGGALKNWFIAQLRRFAGSRTALAHRTIHHRVPAAPLWALLGAVFQFVPQIGAVLGVIGPALTAMFKWGDWEHPLYVLMLYAVIAVVDGFLLQPYIMKRTAKVPSLGVYTCAHRAGDDHSVLGSAVGPAVAGRTVCVQAGSACRQSRMQSPVL